MGYDYSQVQPLSFLPEISVVVVVVQVFTDFSSSFYFP